MGIVENNKAMDFADEKEVRVYHRINLSDDTIFTLFQHCHFVGMASLTKERGVTLMMISADDAAQLAAGLLAAIQRVPRDGQCVGNHKIDQRQMIDILVNQLPEDLSGGRH